MDTTTLNEHKAQLSERTQTNGHRAFLVETPTLNCVFAKKADAKEFKKLYDLSTKKSRPC